VNRVTARSHVGGRSGAAPVGTRLDVGSAPGTGSGLDAGCVSDVGSAPGTGSGLDAGCVSDVGSSPGAAGSEDAIDLARGSVRRPGLLQVLGAFVRRDWAIARSYKLPFVLGLVQTTATLGFLYYLARLVGPRIGPVDGGIRGGYFGFVVIGTTFLTTATAVLTSFAQRLRTDQTTGTLEVVFTMPPPPAMAVLASAAYPALFAGAVAVVEVAVAVGAFGMRFDVDLVSALGAMAGLAGTVVLGSAAGFALATFVLVFKRGESLTALAASALSMLGGVYYPVAVMPEPLRVAAECLPFTWALEVLRDTLLGRHVPLLQMGGLWAAALVALPLSLVVFRAGLRRARRLGTLAQY
jgi:ABC-2 type transport system permease protein